MNLSLVAAELSAQLRNATVQKVYVPESSLCVLEVRTPGHTDLLVLSSAQAASGAWVVDERPVSPAIALGFQQLLRRELAHARIARVELIASRTVRLAIERPTGNVALIAEPNGPLVLTTDSGVVMASSVRREGLRVGTAWAPAGGGTLSEPAAPIELPPAERLAHARAAGVEASAQLTQLATGRVQQQTSAALKKLRRTLDKVRAEAARGPMAEQYRRDGELLARNLHAVERGKTKVVLTDYLPDGEVVEREVTLDPRRSAKAQVEWLFHQGKRLLRGMAMAQQRVEQLEQQERGLLSGELTDDRLAATTGRAKADAASLPFREYLGWNGRKILVGKGARANDELSFKIAAPHHIWLHARGVQGAHVVVPLQKGETLPQELLIDAAHLALHHSGLKGEDRGEVSYTHAKYLRKVKGAPGAVTYSHDKTFWLRVEPARLQRLLSSPISSVG